MNKKLISSLLFALICIFLSNDVFARGGNNGGGSGGTPALEGKIYFYEKGGGPINITKRNDGVYTESFANEYVKNNIEITLVCTSGGGICGDSAFIEVEQNGTGSLTITDTEGRQLTKEFEVIKIDKNPPVGDITYSPENSIWTNGYKTATLSGQDNESWLVGNSTPSYSCNTEGGCTGTLTLTDSAGNILEKAYDIQNIDKTNPNIHVNLYAEILNGKQKVGISCTDLGGSECEILGETIYWLPLGTTSNKCVYDNAGNSTCFTVQTSSSTSDYSDENFPWVSRDRLIYLNCTDNLSGCRVNYVSANIPNNIDDTTLTIWDNAGNSLTKHFHISKIDKVAPIVDIYGLTEYKAFDINQIKISFSDDLSGVNYTKYTWDNTCKDATSTDIIGTPVSNNDWIGYNKSGLHTLHVCSIDNAGNIKEETQIFKIHPGDLYMDEIEISTSSNGDKYANNSDSYNYTLTLKDKYGNLITDKEIILLEQSCSNDDLCKTITTDMLNNTGDSALIELFSNKTNSVGQAILNIKSLAPGKFNERFYIKMNKWNNNYQNVAQVQGIYKTIISGENSFKKPITGEISVVGGGVPVIGNDKVYQIKLTNTGSLSGYSDGKLDISGATIKNKVLGHEWKTFGNIDNSFEGSVSNDLGFSGSIDANDNILKGPIVGAVNLPISYNLGLINIKYYIDDFSTSGCNTETLGLKVVGTLQGDGKSNLTGQAGNFSDISKGSMRLVIRKTAYTLLKNRISGSIVNGIKYVEGDITISGEIPEGNNSYETLIVKNGNVYISNNLNTLGKKLGIIVLKDNYSVKSDYNKIGNIYIGNNVDTIDAIIYADGTFRSADSNGNSYPDSDLNKKLEFYGSLFTRNTIGGAVLAGTNYLLPGGGVTTNFDLAAIYDFNYIRKVDNNACETNKYSFRIKYNPEMQSNPPKGFNN